MKRAPSAILVSFLVLIACRQDGETPVEELRYGTDTCAECGSTIQDPNFAAFYRSAQGTRKVFDDPGCLFRSLRAEAAQVKPVFHEHGGTRWLSGDEVFFAKTPATQSPQGYGWGAYGSFGDAQTAVTSAGAGEILSLAQAKEKIGVASAP
jgi:hypothetical protein